jgi:hypothetical protein
MIIMTIWRADSSARAAILLKELAAKLWGAGAVDPDNNITPMNPDKARFAVWSVLRKELHDSLTLCSLTCSSATV